MSYKTEPANFLRISRRTLGRFREFSARGSRGLCVYTHIESSFLRSLLWKDPPASSGAMTWVNLGYCKRRVRARKRESADSASETETLRRRPKPTQKESKSRLLPLLFRKDRVLHRFADTKLKRCFCWDLDSFAGCGVTAFTRLPL